MDAKELIQKYTMDPHQENGLFLERHYLSEKTGRADSGSIYYYLAPGEITKFHRIDCDEYWCHNAGADVEIWSFTPGGSLKKHLLGISEQAEPVIYFPKGEIFAARLPKDSTDGSFLTCITVPRFSPEGFELFEKEDMIKMYPEAIGFWE